MHGQCGFLRRARLYNRQNGIDVYSDRSPREAVNLPYGWPSQATLECH
jgi:hypothetical protein